MPETTQQKRPGIPASFGGFTGTQGTNDVMQAIQGVEQCIQTIEWVRDNDSIPDSVVKNASDTLHELYTLKRNLNRVSSTGYNSRFSGGSGGQ